MEHSLKIGHGHRQGWPNVNSLFKNSNPLPHIINLAIIGASKKITKTKSVLFSKVFIQFLFEVHKRLLCAIRAFLL